MPDGRIAPDGTLRLGVSRSAPYGAGWLSLTALPRVEVSGRYTRISGVPGFGLGTERTATFGDYKDKTFDIKTLVHPETGWWPSVAAGVQDIFGTGIFRAYYLAASKRIGPLDISAGYGGKRLAGAFGGVRLHLPGRLERWSLVAEYDGYNYERDLGREFTGVDRRRPGMNAALEYRGDSFILQAGRQNDTWSYSAYFVVPLEKREFIPKIDEPEPYTKVTVRPTEQEWASEGKHVSALIRELGRDDFRAIEVRYADRTLHARLTNVRITQTSRAIGRAARILLALGPEETREIRITYTVAGLPLATYVFFDSERLQRYFAGAISRAELAQFVRVDFAEPTAADVIAAERANEVVAALEAARTPLAVRRGDQGDAFSLRYEDNDGNRLWVGPLLSTYLNDPSGAFRFDVSAGVVAERKLADRTFLRGVGTWSIVEDVSGVTQPSNSVLPHVRSDIAEYKRGSRGKLAQLVVNRFDQPSQRIYTRVSGGLYEMMYAGVGGQALYLPERGPWAFDMSADWVRQRDYGGLFGFNPYQTVTAIASLHYRLPYDMTASLRVGRFLARDEGGRVEVKRTFKSGFTVGGWYTVTNGRDITSPGSPTSPYNDKGIFMAIPLAPFLLRDTQATAFFSLAPWTRDVGQMVASPADLYAVVERPLLRGVMRGDRLTGLGDVDDDYPLHTPTTFFEQPHFTLALRDAGRIGKSFATREFWDGAAVVGLLIGAAALADRPVDKQVKRHADASVVKAVGGLGKAVPLAFGVGAAALSVYTDDDRLARTAYSSLRAGVFTLAASQGVRFAVGRARPIDERGAADFDGFSRTALRSSFTSNHVSTAFAFATPLAEEYDMPWLYGLAGLTSLGRVADRKHWVSDTVGGALLGYAMGRAIWSWNRDPKRRGPEIAFDGRSLHAKWTLP